MNRRSFIKGMLAGLSILGFSKFLIAGKAMAADEKIEKITKTDAEWQKLLTPAQYDVLRHEGTETPFTSPLLHEKREGIFQCVGCDLSLFPSKYKFDSGTGWPSFYDSLPGHIETKTDHSLGITRTEYHCARCGGHQGHIFNDGPPPTGLRHCNNGVALKFVPKEG